VGDSNIIIHFFVFGGLVFRFGKEKNIISKNFLLIGLRTSSSKLKKCDTRLIKILAALPAGRVI
jgi:hypothetical protein